MRGVLNLKSESGALITGVCAMVLDANGSLSDLNDCTFHEVLVKFPVKCAGDKDLKCKDLKCKDLKCKEFKLLLAMAPGASVAMAPGASVVEYSALTNRLQLSARSKRNRKADPSALYQFSRYLAHVIVNDQPHGFEPTTSRLGIISMLERDIAGAFAPSVAAFTAQLTPTEERTLCSGSRTFQIYDPPTRRDSRYFWTSEHAWRQNHPKDRLTCRYPTQHDPVHGADQGSEQTGAK
ncbi:hypothetical protein GNI_175190 [Gregarina niphandrodes]|uniref:Uncharacterized protein n=1 Tax=Gregarina niphandrodes TaxID=110365 RepID=A0A023AYN3_GRENI|nr:hypothetical protein GNI_175190 [Gregarina niphandrodes]EZG43375.1 hypothetical protein GNI_175190 [Gregarina niphandrodes]|eukprot:XP_011134648.1 hypothetical protein GNI_175190 [Gregarina niphandrodes]